MTNTEKLIDRLRLLEPGDVLTFDESLLLWEAADMIERMTDDQPNY